MSKRKGDDDLSFLEEGEKSPVGMIIGGVVLLVIIVILCVVIWKMSHKDADGSQPASQGQTTESSVPDTQEGAEPSVPSQEPAEPSAAGGDNGDGAAASQAGNNEPVQPGVGDNASAMTFREVNETVTPKEATNLRSEPSTEKDNTIVVKLKNGETVTRTGLNDDTGWSRLDYNGQTVYALSRLLTADLAAPNVVTEPSKPVSAEPETPASSSGTVSTDSNVVTTQDGTAVTFTPCDDVVSPKMEVNLRGEPSTSQGNSSVHARLKYGETVKRTGYQATTDDTGWSRVEYNGETLYAVTSYLFVVEETDGDGE